MSLTFSQHSIEWQKGQVASDPSWWHKDWPLSESSCHGLYLQGVTSLHSSGLIGDQGPTTLRLPGWFGPTSQVHSSWSRLTHSLPSPGALSMTGIFHPLSFGRLTCLLPGITPLSLLPTQTMPFLLGLALHPSWDCLFWTYFIVLIIHTNELDTSSYNLMILSNILLYNLLKYT
jgi:hypothetical protein